MKRREGGNGGQEGRGLVELVARQTQTLHTRLSGKGIRLPHSLGEKGIINFGAKVGK